MFGVALFPNRNPIFSTPFQSLSIYNTLMTDFIVWLSEFRFAIISLLISAGLKLAELQAYIVPNDDARKKQYVLRSIAIFFKK
jgi:hypothetical protein